MSSKCFVSYTFCITLAFPFRKIWISVSGSIFTTRHAIASTNSFHYHSCYEAYSVCVRVMPLSPYYHCYYEIYLLTVTASLSPRSHCCHNLIVITIILFLLSDCYDSVVAMIALLLKPHCCHDPSSFLTEEVMGN
jgi:hypothetical protein